MADADHSLLSASGADGMAICRGKPAMEKGRKTTNDFADKGTAIHDLASRVMQNRIDGGDDVAANHIGEKIRVGKKDWRVDADMAETADDYVDRFMLATQGRNVLRFSEQRVHYHAYLGVPKGLAWGTSDGTAILFDQPALVWTDPQTGKDHKFAAGDELVVDDLKTGMGVIVWANTLQLKCYGAGAFYQWEPVANITRVRLRITQPPKDHYDEIVMTPQAMLKALEPLRDAVPDIRRAIAIAEKFREEQPADSGLGLGELLHAEGLLRPDDKACRFCDAKAICPAIARDVAETVDQRGRRLGPMDFDDLDVQEAADVSDSGHNYLVMAYAKLDMIDAWAKAILAEIDRRILIKGEKFPGLKVVAGKKGKREWIDPADVEAYVRRSVPAAIRPLLFKEVLLTYPQAEKALKTSPKTLAGLHAFMTQKEGKPSVAVTNDPRPAISHQSMRDQFDDLDAEEQPAPRRGEGAGRAAHPFR